jgi:predicted DNA-binding transcriptional regulator AlpA
MKEFEFTLKFDLSDSLIEPDAFIGYLEKEGCDDALVGVGQKKRIALQFNREAETALDAVISAIKDIERAIPDAKLIEATPDIVGLSDIAEVLNFSRQNMRKLMLNNIASFPAPIHEGKISLWHLSNVLTWFKKEKSHVIDDQLIDIAKANMQLNFVKEVANLEPAFQSKIVTAPKKSRSNNYQEGLLLSDWF